MWQLLRVVADIGLTPRRCQSGRDGDTGLISRCGDRQLRHTCSRRPRSSLRSWLLRCGNQILFGGRIGIAEELLFAIQYGNSPGLAPAWEE